MIKPITLKRVRLSCNSQDDAFTPTLITQSWSHSSMLLLHFEDTLLHLIVCLSVYEHIWIVPPTRFTVYYCCYCCDGVRQCLCGTEPLTDPLSILQMIFFRVYSQIQKAYCEGSRKQLNVHAMGRCTLVWNDWSLDYVTTFQLYRLQSVEWVEMTCILFISG